MPFAAIVLMGIAAGCGTANTETIGKNVDPDANLSNVTTYAWISDIDKIPESRVFVSPTGVYVFNNESARNKIKDAINYELDARGYDKNDSDAGMLVSFYVLEQSDSLRTTNGYVEVGGERVLTEDNVSYTPVDAGTLIINIINNKSDKLVWQGFASGILHEEDLNNQSKIREAVHSIFSEFEYNNR